MSNYIKTIRQRFCDFITMKLQENIIKARHYVVVCLSDWQSRKMRIWLFVLSVLSVLSVLPQLCPGLSVVPDDWRPRERGVRGARGYGQARGINLYGSAKRHGAGRQECPRDQKILPCRCKAKTNGLDITCEKVSLSQIKHSSEALKKEFKNRSNSEVVII